MNTARRLKLRPSKPEAQATKANNISNEKLMRASGRLQHAASLAETKADEIELDPATRREREATFRQWFPTSFPDSETLLGQDGFEKFAAAARCYVMGSIDYETWRGVKSAYDAARAATSPPRYESPVRRPAYHYSRPDGW